MEAWSLANPGSSFRVKIVDDLRIPSLRSARNSLGVLAGVGETSLSEDGSAEVRSLKDQMVE